MKRILTLIILSALCLTMVIPVAAEQKMSDWAKGEVAEAEASLALPKSLGDDLTLPITRLEFCTLTAEMLDKLVKLDVIPEESHFTDTDDDNVMLLYSAEIVVGTSETTFSPDLKITREEAATFLYRAARYLDLYLPELMDDYPYVDSENISRWALDPVRYMFAAKIMIGTEDFHFMPADTYTKEQSIATILRLYKYAGGETVTDDSFSYSLMQSMDEKSNYCVSPLSIKAALAMAANGASGDTKAQILSAVGIDDLDGFNETVKDIIDRYSDGESIRLDIADSLWINEDNSNGIKFADDYKSLIKNFFVGTASTVDNKNAVETINKWVAENTNNKIDSIIDTPDFSAALINAIYFKGAWNQKFEKNATHKADFTDADGIITKIDFMEQTDSFDFYDDGNGTKIIRLPYSTLYKSGSEEWDLSREQNKGASMYIISGEDVDIENLPAAADFNNKKVHFTMPKFKVESSVTLNDILKALGMTDAFDENKADFTSMFDGGNMFISNVLHKTYIDVDEEGTEAAAVTAIMMEATAEMPIEIIEFKVDRPFTYVIREDITGEVLFAGEYRYVE